MVGFLSSEETSYITGQIVCVDGGMAMKTFRMEASYGKK